MMIMSLEPDDIDVLFLTVEETLAIDTGPKTQAFQHFKNTCDVSMAQMVRVGLQDAYMLMDEEALLHSPPPGVNKVATCLLNSYCLDDGVPTPYLIRGPVMIVGASDDGEIDMSCPRMIYAKALLLMKFFALSEDEAEHLLDF